MFDFEMFKYYFDKSRIASINLQIVGLVSIFMSHNTLSKKELNDLLQISDEKMFEAFIKSKSSSNSKEFTKKEHELLISNLEKDLTDDDIILLETIEGLKPLKNPLEEAIAGIFSNNKRAHLYGMLNHILFCALHEDNEDKDYDIPENLGGKEVLANIKEFNLN